MKNDKMTKKKSRLLPLLGIGVFLAIGVFGIRSVVENVKYASSTSQLANRQAKLKALGVVFDGESVEYYKKEFIQEFETASFKSPSAEINETTEIATTLLADTKLIEILKSKHEKSTNAVVPHEMDFLIKQNSIGSKRAAGSLRTYVEESIAENRIDDALNGCEVISGIQNAILVEPSDEMAVFWYGINSSLMQYVWQLSQVPGLNATQRTRLLELVSPNGPILSIKSIAVRQCSEMVSLTRALGTFDLEKKLVLQSQAEGNYLGDLAEKKIARDAMESELLQVWLDVFNQYTEEGDQEVVGAYMDDVVQKRFVKVDDLETEYMILTMPFLFEQIGRMNSRVASARAILKMILENNCKVGDHVVKMSGIDVEFSVAENNSNWVISTPDHGPNEKFKSSYGLELNQIKGVRLIAKK